MNSWITILVAFVWSAFKYSIGASIAVTTIQSAIVGFIVTTLGAVTGIIFFTKSEIWIKQKFSTYFKSKKKFTKTRRWIVRIKKMGGLPLIALLTPVLLSIPLGCFLAATLERNQKKIIWYHVASVLFWGSIYFYLKQVLNINPFID